MKNKTHSTAFYIEAIVLALIVILVSTGLVYTFGRIRKESQQAQLLTGSVILAERVSEAVSAADSMDDVLDLLDAEGADVIDDENAETIFYDIDLNPVSEDRAVLALTLELEPEQLQTGVMLNADISVCSVFDGKEQYRISTSHFVKGGVR